MAMWVCCDSGLSEVETSRKIKELEDKYPEIMRDFWVSKPKPCDRFAREDDL
jgi:transcription initiation factor IIE alpha subunit